MSDTTADTNTDTSSSTTATAESTTKDDNLGPAGEQALDAFKKRARDAEARVKAQESELEKLRDAQRSESEKAVEKARKEATEQARSEVLAAANRRILTAEVRAAAGGRLADPLDAVRLLDVDAFSVNEDGEVDTKAITKAIDGLLDAKPYLAANAKRFEGSADGGARQSTTADDKVSPGLGRLVSAYANTKPNK